MPKFRKKPVVIEAIQFDGSTTSAVALEDWMRGRIYIQPSINTRDLRDLEIRTLEGVMNARPSDWIIKGVRGEFYPCKPDVFAATYEPVEDDS